MGTAVGGADVVDEAVDLLVVAIAVHEGDIDLDILDFVVEFEGGCDGLAFVQVRDELGDRITSYNVCYTKLLRAAVVGQGVRPRLQVKKADAAGTEQRMAGILFQHREADGIAIEPGDAIA